MNLNDLLKKTIKNKKESPSKNINLQIIQMYILLGTRIVLIYLFFIFLIGKYIAKLFGYNNLYFTSIIIATIINFYIIFEVIEKSKNK